MPPLVPDRLASGRVIDLAAMPPGFDWAIEIAAPGARIARFAGQVPDFIYSVAEHEVRGGDAIMAERLDLDVSERRLVACAFLLHDAHETLTGDAKRPFVDLVEMLAARSGLAPGGLVRRAIAEAKNHLDAAIFRAAGLPWPLAPSTAAIVADMDERMAAEELRRFWPRLPLPPAYAERARVVVPDWRGRLAHDATPWEWPRAAAEWMDRFNRWAPVKAGRRA
jgi:hypothetical protein